MYVAKEIMNLSILCNIMDKYKLVLCTAGMYCARTHGSYTQYWITII
jgi:hypothetical protein